MRNETTEAPYVVANTSMPAETARQIAREVVVATQQVAYEQAKLLMRVVSPG